MPRKTSGRMRAAGRWLAGGLAGLLIALVLVLLLFRFVNPPTSAFMLAYRIGHPDQAPSQQWVALEAISPWMPLAVVASEDQRFPEHWGLDLAAIRSAVREYAQGEGLRGASTITQQLAKNLFLTSKRSYIRKAQELVIALMIEALWDKRRILEVYLNVVEWGNGVYGAQAGAKHHYGVSAAQLSSYQAARMAGMLPAPRYFDKRRNSPFLARKTGTLQKRMYQVTVPK